MSDVTGCEVTVLPAGAAERRQTRAAGAEGRSEEGPERQRAGATAQAGKASTPLRVHCKPSFIVIVLLECIILKIIVKHDSPMPSFISRGSASFAYLMPSM